MGLTKEKVVVGAALPRVDVWFFTKYRATGIARSRNAKLPRRKNLFLNIFMQHLVHRIKLPAMQDDISVEDLGEFCK